MKIPHRLSLMMLFLFFCGSLSPLEVAAASPALNNVDLSVSSFLPQTLRSEALELPARLVENGNALNDRVAQALRASAELQFLEKDGRMARRLCRILVESGVAPGSRCWGELARYEQLHGSDDRAIRMALLSLMKADEEQTGDCGSTSATMLVLGNALGSQARYQDALLKPFVQVAHLGLDIAEKCPQAQALLPQLYELIEQGETLNKNRTSTVLVSSESEAHTAAPALCLNFNDELRPADSVDYAQYLRVSPAFATRYRIHGRELCMDGADFDKSYQVEVLPGLATMHHTVTELQEANDVHTDSRQEKLWFENNRYILPVTHGEKGAVAVHSINLDSAELSIYRIDERNLQNNFVQSSFADNLSPYETGQLLQSSGRRIWSGTLHLSGKKDRIRTHALHLPPEVSATPGIYVVRADYSQSSYSRPCQWLVVSDIGMTSYSGESGEGLHVTLRSLSSAKPLSGVTVKLYARNNTILATAVSDSLGCVHFAAPLLAGKNGQRPQLVAAGEGSGYGFSLLHLSDSAFDLSDRGVSGRPPAGTVDGWSYTDRGIYRPGETVHSVTLLRDRMGRGVQDAMPLTLKLFGPDDGPVLEQVVKPESGAWSAALPLAAGARSGSWKIRLSLGKEVLAESGFEVKSFVPPRIKVELKAEPERAAVSLQADYLYGAPAAGLDATGRVNYRLARHPFPAWKRYFFGSSFSRTREEMATGTTGADGSLRLAFTEVPQTLQPLRAEVAAEVMDVDGRAATATVSMPLLRAPYYVGIHPVQKGDVAADREVSFQLQAVDAAGAPIVVQDTGWRLVREERHGEWYHSGDSWHWRETVDEHEVGHGSISFTDNGSQKLSRFITHGWHRLEVFNDRKELLTSYRFYAGWRAAESGSGPDRLELTALGEHFAPGTTAKVKITAPWAGEASLVLGDETFYSMQNFTMTAEEQVIDVPVKSDWGAGKWAIVTVYRPGTAVEKGADRAIGVIWLGTDSSRRTLTMHIDAPEKVCPRQTINVPVTVQGTEEGDTAFFTLAAVDEGVLGLTRFQSPDPMAWFFQRRRLGLSIRDLYSRLLSAAGAPDAVLHFGAGDDAGRRGAPRSNVEVVSLFSGVVAVGPGGRAVVPLQLPDFNGQLRLMAVGWSASGLGAADVKMKVHDPVALSASLPRFLARGDHSAATLLVQNLDGVEGTYHLSAVAKGAIRLDGTSEAAFSLKKGERRTVRFPLAAETMGEGEVSFTLTGPGERQEYSVTSRRTIAVRGASLPQLRRQYLHLEPGGMMVVRPESLGGFYPEGASVSLDLSSQMAMDVKGLLEQLDRYPYGCLEQLTSRALPLLYLNRLVRFYGGKEEKNALLRLEKAVRRILDKQRFDGSFGLWDRSSEVEPWLTCYALDFLLRAQAAGVSVPESALRRGVAWLQGQVSASQVVSQRSFLVYAHLVLAESGNGRPEELRYYADNIAASMEPLQLAQLGAALKLSGEVTRGNQALIQAVELAIADRTPPEKNCQAADYDYGSQLRDVAAVLALCGEFAETSVDTAPLWVKFNQLQSSRHWHSTQEQAAMVMAVASLQESATFTATIDEREVEGKTLHLVRTAAELQQPITVKNTGTTGLWLTITCQGTVKQKQKPTDSGFSVQSRWYSVGGELLDGRTLAQGDLVVEVVEVTEALDVPGQAMVISLLPAGLEYDRRITAADWNSELFGRLDNGILYSDGMDDRFVTAWVAGEEGSRAKHRFRTAHLLRVVSPGEFAVPAAEVEMMYSPNIRGNGQAGRLTVTQAP